MKKLLFVTFVMAGVIGAGMYSQATSQDVNAEDCMFLSGLHHTARGMGYWYDKENGGLENITGIPYDNLGCKNCHVQGCDTCHKEVKDGKAAYSANAAKDQSICLKCHGREKAIMRIDREAAQKDTRISNDMKCREKADMKTEHEAHEATQVDVHVSNGMECMDCHSAKEMHGDGVAYDSMRQTGAMDTRCENCHDDISPSNSHLAHEDKLDCKACHVRHVLSCTNCHFDTLVEKGKRVAIPVSGWVFLINHRGKVTSGSMQTFVTKGNKTFLMFAPHMSHSIMRDGRKCEECHGIETAKQAQKGKVALTWLKDGKLENQKGVIPVADGVDYQCAYQNREGDKWVPIENPEKPMVQYPAFGSPLSKQQLDSLVKVHEMPAPKMK